MRSCIGGNRLDCFQGGLPLGRRNRFNRRSFISGLCGQPNPTPDDGDPVRVLRCGLSHSRTNELGRLFERLAFAERKELAPSRRSRELEGRERRIRVGERRIQQRLEGLDEGS